jgi:RNA polymerase sigma factor (sigma-70 family)
LRGGNTSEERTVDPALEFEQLMERVRAGCPDAAQALYDRFSDAVRRVVRRNLAQRLRRQYDSTDFTQSVWASFFMVPAEQFTFANPESLVAFLSRVAYNKVTDATRQRMGTQKNDLQRETELDSPGPHDQTPLAEVLPAPTATPSQYVMAEERWQRLLDAHPPGHQRVLEMLRQGHSHVEITHSLGVHPKVIQRLVQQVRMEFE